MECQSDWILDEALHEQVFGGRHHWNDRIKFHELVYNFARHVKKETAESSEVNVDERKGKRQKISN